MSQTSFPSLKPSSRSFDPGNYPVKAYNAQDGAEFRILYGNKRVAAKLQLSYNNISDTEAADFVEHFDHTKGTFTLFTINNDTKSGFSGGSAIIDKPSGSKWRYAEPPQLQSVYPGVSNVTVNLISATDT